MGSSMFVQGATPPASGRAGIDLGSLLLGAALALAAQMFVQLVVVPRVDARRRREDRWERDLIALGELLTNEAVKAMADARHAIRWAATVVMGEIELRPERRQEAEREAMERERTATKAASDMLAHVEWLAERIDSLAPGRLVAFKHAALMYEVHASLAWGHGWRLSLGPAEFDVNKFEADWLRQEVDRKALVDAVKQLLRAPRPPRGGKARRRLRALRVRAAKIATRRRQKRNGTTLDDPSASK